MGKGGNHLLNTNVRVSGDALVSTYLAVSSRPATPNVIRLCPYTPRPPKVSAPNVHISLPQEVSRRTENGGQLQGDATDLGELASAVWTGMLSPIALRNGGLIHLIGRPPRQPPLASNSGNPSDARDEKSRAC